MIIICTKLYLTTNARTIYIYECLHRDHVGNIVICEENIVETPQTHVIVITVGWTSTGTNIYIAWCIITDDIIIKLESNDREQWRMPNTNFGVGIANPQTLGLMATMRRTHYTLHRLNRASNSLGVRALLVCIKYS